jgi:hypothetical protein
MYAMMTAKVVERDSKPTSRARSNKTPPLVDAIRLVQRYDSEGLRGPEAVEAFAAYTASFARKTFWQDTVGARHWNEYPDVLMALAEVAARARTLGVLPERVAP